MTEKKEHPHAWVLHEIADGAKLEDFECKSVGWDGWESVSGYGAWVCLPEKWQVRRKIKMHRIGEHEFPAPMAEAPALGSDYWHADPVGVRFDRWEGEPSDFELLGLGILHATKEAAEAHSKAQAAIVRGVPV